MKRAMHLRLFSALPTALMVLPLVLNSTSGYRIVLPQLPPQDYMQPNLEYSNIEMFYLPSSLLNAFLECRLTILCLVSSVMNDIFSRCQCNQLNSYLRTVSFIFLAISYKKTIKIQ